MGCSDEPAESAATRSVVPIRGPISVAVFGPVYCDLVFGGLERLPRLGEGRFARRFLATAGGSASSAIALHRLGHRVALVTEVGDDAHGGIVRACLADECIDERWLRIRPDVPTPVTVAMNVVTSCSSIGWKPRFGRGSRSHGSAATPAT